MLLHLDRDHLRDAGLFHGDAVEGVVELHRLLVVRDEDELALGRHLAKKRVELSDVRVVQRRIDFVEDAERATA